MLDIDGIKYVSAVELTRELGISRQTLWRWRMEEKIPQGYRFRNKRIVYTLPEAETIRQHALRLEPLEPTEKAQLNLFDPRTLSAAKATRSDPP